MSATDGFRVRLVSAILRSGDVLDYRPALAQSSRRPFSFWRVNPASAELPIALRIGQRRVVRSHGASCPAPPPGARRLGLRFKIPFMLCEPGLDRFAPVKRFPADRDARRPGPRRVPAGNRPFAHAKFASELGRIDVIAENGWRGQRDARRGRRGRDLWRCVGSCFHGTAARGG
jgi:hypothetical protein